MENAYGIGVRNRYDLFYNEDVDPFEILKKQEEEKERRKTEKSLPKEKVKSIKPGKTVPTSSVPKKGKETAIPSVPKTVEVTEQTNKPRNRTFGDKSKTSDDSKDNEERKNFRNREEQNTEQRERGDGEFNRGGYRGRGVFRGRGRGSRGRGGLFSNFENRKRDFDRHSGSDRTGIRAVDKREGAGQNNWGSAKDECFLETSQQDTSSTWEEIEETPEKKDVNPIWEESSPTSENQTATEPVVPDDANAENTDSKENVPIVDEAADEAARQMTLDEWKREQETKRAVPKFNLRKPGEGEDGTQWKKLYMLKKKAKEDDDEEDDEDVEDEELGQRGRHRQLVDIQINFSDSRRGRGRGRGARGSGPRGGGIQREERGIREPGSGNTGGMGRMNRGPPKIGKTSQQSAPRVDDWNDFPSLVTA